MNKQRLTLQLGDVTLAYSLFTKHTFSTDSDCIPNDTPYRDKRRIMLLHGAGVAGELTWTFIANYLAHWDEVLIPDLLGMGDSFYEPTDNETFTINDMMQSLFSLLRHHNWQGFDLAGYSLGGLVALELNREICERVASCPANMSVGRLCLIEPALFSDQSLRSALAFRETFTPIANNIKADPADSRHFIEFLDLVSPHRKGHEKTDALAVQRLQVRPHGFANALLAVSYYAKSLNERSLEQLLAVVPPGVGIIGGLSREGLMLAQQNIQHYQPNWHIESLDNADHSLVYVRPKKVAHLINTYLC